jgi:cytochrome c biogenesis protein CcdA
MSYRDIQVEPGTANSRPLGELIANVVGDLKTILHDEIRLVLMELKDKIGKSRKGAVYIAVALLLGFLSVECLITCCIAALAIVLPLWLSALIVAVLAAIVAGGVFVVGTQALQKVDPLPQQTLESLKDNLDWVRERLG